MHTHPCITYCERYIKDFMSWRNSVLCVQNNIRFIPFVIRKISLQFSFLGQPLSLKFRALIQSPVAMVLWKYCLFLMVLLELNKLLLWKIAAEFWNPSKGFYHFQSCWQDRMVEELEKWLNLRYIFATVSRQMIFPSCKCSLLTINQQAWGLEALLEKLILPCLNLNALSNTVTLFDSYYQNSTPLPFLLSLIIDQETIDYAINKLIWDILIW